MSHTYPLHVHYHRCPKCGKILESRKDYQYVLGKYVKQLRCTHCRHAFSETKPWRPKFRLFNP